MPYTLFYKYSYHNNQIRIFFVRIPMIMNTDSHPSLQICKIYLSDLRKIPRGRGVTRPEKWRGCADRKSKKPPTHPYFFQVNTHIYRFFDGYFSTFLSVFDNLFIITREIESNYEILDDDWRFWDDFWWTP